MAWSIRPCLDQNLYLGVERSLGEVHFVGLERIIGTDQRLSQGDGLIDGGGPLVDGL